MHIMTHFIQFAFVKDNSIKKNVSSSPRKAKTDKAVIIYVDVLDTEFFTFL